MLTTLLPAAGRLTSCEHCAGPIVARRPHARFCSAPCRRNAARRRSDQRRKMREAAGHTDPVLAANRARSRGRYYRTYGITEEWYQETLAAQGGGCATCGRTPEQEGKRLAVDHCHTTHVVRGILCEHCNRALGLVMDCPVRLRALAEYVAGR